MEISVYNIQGEDTGRMINLSENVFCAKPNDHVIYLSVKQYLANKRQGTAKSKERNEVVGSRRKLGHQKGSGCARRGDAKSPIMRGGGQVFGPKLRNYKFKLNKKEKILARRSVLSYKMYEGSITVVEDFSFEIPGTKKFLSLVRNLKIVDKKILVVLSRDDENIFLSTRNLKKVKVITVSELNVYKILEAAHLVVLEKSVNALNNF